MPRREGDAQREDIGCLTATKYLGRQSRCLECPFSKCAHESGAIADSMERHEKRDKEVLSMHWSGMGKPEIARVLGVSVRTVNRLLSGK